MPTYNFSATIAEGDDYSVSQEVISYDGTAQTVNGTAKANSDYVPINLDEAGGGNFEYTLETVNDNVYEGDEEFYVDYDVDVVANFNGQQIDTNVNGRITVTIDDEEDRPTISIETVAVDEGGPDVTYYVKITASNASSKDYTINLTGSGTASEGNDFSIDDTSITMKALETEALIPITVFGDDDQESNETINLIATSSVAGQAQATFTILNDDEGGPSGPVVTVAVDDGLAFEGPYTTLNYTVSQFVDYAIDVTIDVPQQFGSQLSDITFRIPAGTAAGSKVDVLLALSDAQREQIKSYGVTYSAAAVAGGETVFAGVQGSSTAPLQIQVADELLYNLQNPPLNLIDNVEPARQLLLSVAEQIFGDAAIHTSDAQLEAADTAAGNARLLVALARAADLLDLETEAQPIYAALSAGLDAAATDAERFEAAQAAYADLFNLVAADDFGGPGGSGLGAEIAALDLSDFFIPTLSETAATLNAVLTYDDFDEDVKAALADQYAGGDLPAAGVTVNFVEVAAVAGANVYAASGGDNTYFVDDAGDQTTEGGPEGGYDQVIASVDYTIGDGIEALQLADGATNGTGNGLDNLILGNAVANTLVGGSGDDTLYGDDGNDTFDAGTGDDVVLGGSGTDTILFDFNRADLSVKVLSDGKVYIEEPEAGGTDILIDVERVDVNDGALLYGIDSQNLSFAYRIYAAAYGRTPDEAGLLFWTDVLDDRGEGPPTTEDKEYIASFFLTANEYIDIYGENPTNEEYINKLYQNVLHREADQAGYDFWLGVLSSGQGKDDMLIWFTDSEENLQNTAPDLDNGVWVL